MVAEDVAIQDSDEHVAEDTTQWVTFRLAEEKYGVGVSYVKEVLKELDIAPVPGAPEFVLGIINLRGNVVTVMDTRKRLNLPLRDIDEDSRIVILEYGEEMIGMVVDSVAEVIDLTESEIETAPNVGNDESSKYIQGVSNQKDELLILVDLEKLLEESKDERGMF